MKNMDNNNKQKIKILKLQIGIIILFLIMNLLLLFSMIFLTNAYIKHIKNYHSIEIEQEEILSIPDLPSAGVESVLNNNNISTQVSRVSSFDVVSLGEHKLTAYCSCEKCCGKWSKYNKTASGTTPKQGRTVACNSLDFGTKIMINGEEYIVEDTGNMKSDNHIDIYFSSHEEALKFGVQNAEVYQILN